MHIGWYGVGYVLAIAVLVLVTQRQAIRYGFDPSHVTNALIVTVILAVIGGRLYHVIDQWGCAPAVTDASGAIIRAAQLCYSQNLPAIVLPPYAGLGIYGGVAGAILGIFYYTRRNRLPIWRALDAVVPGALFAQGIARWGNFFNQELYGPPTSAPWGIAIDCAHRVPSYPCPQFPITTGFEPLFFYESVLDIGGGLLALWLVRRYAGRLRMGDIGSFWAIWYGSVRFVLEYMRQSYDWTIAGIPTAQLIGIGLAVFGVATILWRRRRPQPPEFPPSPASDPIVGREPGVAASPAEDGAAPPPDPMPAPEPSVAALPTPFHSQGQTTVALGG